MASNPKTQGGIWMSVSYCLECSKCKLARETLQEVGQDDVAETLLECYYFTVDENIDNKIFLEWFTKHSLHSEIVFTGY